MVQGGHVWSFIRRNWAGSIGVRHRRTSAGFCEMDTDIYNGESKELVLLVIGGSSDRGHDVRGRENKTLNDKDEVRETGSSE